MVPLNELTKETILSEEVLTEVFDQEDEIYRQSLLTSLSFRAKELKCKTEFTGMVRAFKHVDRKTQKIKSAQVSRNWTDFKDCPYGRMRCGSWIATDEKVYKQNLYTRIDILACYHPILPLERLRNLETGEEQIKIAFKRNGKWHELIVPKTMVASANKIVNLSGRGISVTSENAKPLVQYLSEVENLNEDYIRVQSSSSKLGWVKDGEQENFLPYDSEIIFDGNDRFKQIYESIRECGDREVWFDHIKKLRKSGRLEIKFMMAASFASVLIYGISALPFIVDLWGETEGGKTVTLMSACSIWACPDENRYIGDFKTTDVALEARADMLNSLPVILDDTSKTSSRIRDNFEGVVYDLCSGKGKSRSNKELGVNRENHWQNCFLTNGERPLSGYVNQGGAINRILEVECGEKIFEDPQETANILKRNYGFAGKEFIRIIRELGWDKIREMQQELQRQLMSDDKMQKQAISLSIVLTADRIATEYLFKDGQYISISDAKKTLIDRNELSDNERAYHYIMDKISMNEQRFDDITKCEKWGMISTKENCAIINSAAFDDLCRSGGFSKKSFLSWADKKGLLQTQNGRLTKVKKIEGISCRCVWLKIGDEMMADADGFVPAETFDQGEIPFD
ncbi:MAG: DUF927 domain-containing protein [Clostridiaceae bacterium]|nr:DUF927 domain-containing protein [Clostridiaceae bacterium]